MQFARNCGPDSSGRERSQQAVDEVHLTGISFDWSSSSQHMNGARYV